MSEKLSDEMKALLSSETTEIHVRVRQGDGTYEERWISVHDFKAFFERTILEVMQDVFTSIRDSSA